MNYYTSNGKEVDLSTISVQDLQKMGEDGLFVIASETFKRDSKTKKQKFTELEIANGKLALVNHCKSLFVDSAENANRRHEARVYFTEQVLPKINALYGV